ncbi:glycosyl hydrolase family 88 [Echinicola pacifica]|uniref:Glycosyl hydrolase family 88 n=1 Tax=Echinicola pacifica TaxID=346377 RepID=A0A918UTK7_9BACT|nr:glycoside hydrolase family 88 protein [Echinicola pacifica]GGZ33186.1 glycosyl hydrolase family 88 [Echinicola pacifica]
MHIISHTKVRIASVIALLVIGTPVIGQEVQTDSNTPLHLIQPAYEIPYGQVTANSVEESLSRILHYLQQNTPYQFLNKEGKPVELGQANEESLLKKGDFRIFSYEWGVTYAGMLAAGEAMDNSSYTEYALERLEFLDASYTHFSKSADKSQPDEGPIARVMHPHALDDAGALCAALIKAKDQGLNRDIRPLASHYIDFIMQDQYRFSDGTLARNRPVENTLWLDDLFMSVPALAQMGKLTGEEAYYDEAVTQVLAFAERMFNEDKGLFMHGWVLGADSYPQFHWGRANGWAFMTLVELLDVLPEQHPQRADMMDLFRKHAMGLASYQSSIGFWHQLLDRNDSYLETSATAIFTYGFAKAINKGWLDYRVFGPMTLLGWAAVDSKINDQGQVEGTCVGTGMGFDPAFYYHRPVSVYAAHGYGPALLAGAEVYQLIGSHPYEINETAVQFLENK